VHLIDWPAVTRYKTAAAPEPHRAAVRVEGLNSAPQPRTRAHELRRILSP